MYVPLVFTIVVNGNARHQARITETGDVWVYANGWWSCGQLHSNDPDPLETARQLAGSTIDKVASGEIRHPDRP